MTKEEMINSLEAALSAARKENTVNFLHMHFLSANTDDGKFAQISYTNYGNGAKQKENLNLFATAYDQSSYEARRDMLDNLVSYSHQLLSVHRMLRQNEDCFDLRKPDLAQRTVTKKDLLEE